MIYIQSNELSLNVYNICFRCRSAESVTGQQMHKRYYTSKKNKNNTIMQFISLYFKTLVTVFLSPSDLDMQQTVVCEMKHKNTK